MKPVSTFLLVSSASLCGAMSLVACGRSTSPPDIEAQRITAALQPIGSCAEVDAYFRKQALDAMNAAIDAAKKSWSESRSNGYGCGASYDEAPTGASAGGTTGGTGGPAPSPADPASDSKGPTSASGTNNQVAGVDEADFLKNDGKFIYVAANGAFRILSAWPAATMHEVANVTLEGEPKKLFVEGNRAVVYTSVPPSSQGPSNGADGPYYPRNSGSECTYGYDCDFTGDGNDTRIVVFDITDRAHPQAIRTLAAPSSLVSARRIGTAVHTVLATPPPGMPYLPTWPSDLSSCGSVNLIEASMSFEKLRASNTKLIEAFSVSKGLPMVTDSAGKAPAAEGCSGLYRTSLADGKSFTTLVSFDMASEGAIQTSTIVSRPGAVYASDDALYLSVRHERNGQGDWYDGLPGETEASDVHKFLIGAKAEDTRYLASGLVKGRALNQFALDQYDGKLRIATTSGHLPSPDAYNTLTVLAQNGAALTQTGIVDKLAPAEDIRSVRFDGPRGYVVTFKKTDPLFVLDLADATKPNVQAELKIPGFSTYMHMMDENHLLTIGYDADDQGDFAFFSGVLLQIFDVTDPKNPVRSHKESIGTRGSSSEALTNHLAFTYLAERNLLALPMTVCEGGGVGQFGTDMTFSGLMVYDVTAQSGFRLRGKVAHPSTSQGGYDGSRCSNWWSNASSEVRRSIFMDDFVYSVSMSVVKAQSLTTLGTDVASVSLE